MKIFGIGLSRTGTVSLTHALKVLGYDTEHNAVPIYFPGLFYFINKHDAFADSQIAIQYKVLDKLYPRSKFILTERKVEGWLKSYENRIKYWKQIGSLWEILIHNPLYGTFKYDKEKFKEGFFKHNKEVKEYFKNRPNDFLVINFSKKVGWGKLCKFLNKPTPKLPFPHLNKSTYLIKHAWKDKVEKEKKSKKIEEVVVKEEEREIFGMMLP